MPVNFVDNGDGALLASLLLSIGHPGNVKNGVEDMKAENIDGIIEFTIHHQGGTWRDRVSPATLEVTFLQHQKWTPLTEFLHVMAVRARMRSLFFRYLPTLVDVVYF